jgi:hypothetical protein
VYSERGGPLTAKELDEELVDLDEPFTQEEIDKMLVSKELDLLLETHEDDPDPEDVDLSGLPDDDAILAPVYPYWKKLVAAGTLKEDTPAKIHDVRALKLNGKVNRKDATKHRDPKYVDPTKFKLHEITKSTILWYPVGDKPLRKDGRQKLMALYLKDVIPVDARNIALKGLTAMRFDDPDREETKNGGKFNGPGAKVKAGELTFGFTDRGTVQSTHESREPSEDPLGQRPAYQKLKPILREINNIYSRTLPLPFGEQNRPMPGQHTKDGGVHEEFRNFGTAFSTISVLKSCPSAVHVDAGNGQGFSVLTGVRGPDFICGGEFCFIEYGLKISVEPGDLLIGATMREWHCNLTPVQGTKYSIIAYYRRGLGSIKRREGWAKNQVRCMMKMEKDRFCGRPAKYKAAGDIYLCTEHNAELTEAQANAGLNPNECESEEL